MDQVKTKVCRMCYKEIDSRARICPHCRRWQSILWKLLWVAGLVMLAVPVCALLLGGLGLYRIYDEGERFSDYLDPIAVVSSEFKFGERKDRATVAVVGKVKNNSDIAWKNIQFEVQFFNREGKMVDTEHKGSFSMVLLPDRVNSFKVSFAREFPVSEYASHAVRVTYARDESGWL